MKQNRNRLIFTPLAAVALLVAGSLAGCTKSDLSLDNRDRMEIAPLVTVGGSSAEAVLAYGSSAQSRAAASGNQALGLYFARADETSASAYNTYGATAITATRTAGAGEQPLSFDPAQYYLADGLKTKLTGWYPSGTHDGTAHTVSWTIDGQQDIMTAPAQQGSRTSAMPAMTFDHRLTQLQFYPYAQTQSAIDAWGKITKIEVLNQQNTVVYDLANDATGAVSFSGDKTNNFSAGIAAGGAALSLSTTANRATDAQQMGNAVMIAPQSAADHVLTLRVTTSQNMYKDVTLTQALTAGVPYRLYMDFKQLDIIIETTVVANWCDVATSDNIGGIRIGDYMDGGLVYYIDPANPQKYKVMSLEESATGLKWTPIEYYNAISDAQSFTDGKANSVAIKAAFDARMVDGGFISESTFDAAFPAAAYCHNYKGTAGTDTLGTWHLPALNELQYLYCAYNGVPPSSWAVFDEPPPTPVPAEQEKWNNLIKARGVPVGITDGKIYWSSTDSPEYVAWGLTFAKVYAVDASVEGVHPKTANDGYVRCVRDIAPPPPVVGDYYYSDGSYSTALKAGKTATGLVYYLDPTDPWKYKVMALEESTNKLKWAASNSYFVSDAQSFTDGKANSVAIQTAFDAGSAHIPITETDFAVAFPAAAYCYNYKGKAGTDAEGSWHLPARNECQWLCCAYNGKAPTGWATGISTGISDATAQTSWNNRITAGGGAAGITDGIFWSSTDYMNSTYVWYINFSSSDTNNVRKEGDLSGNGLYVRCIRDI